MQFDKLPTTPFLKWAGGKRALLGHILPNIPPFPGTYFEPFLGAGAVFFQMSPSTPKVASDLNLELIETYLTVRDEPDALIEKLRGHVNDKEYFLRIRNLDREASYSSQPRLDRAARFIYLNKTCFNGLYRVNSRGEFNVPFGNQKNPDIASEKQIRTASEFLNHQSESGQHALASQILSKDYKEITASAGKGDFVYLDPPYHPVSSTSNFVTYGKDGFSEANQIELRNEVLRLHELGTKVLISNSDTELIRTLFDESLFSLKQISVRRSISAKAEGRAAIGELLISNYGLN